MPSIGFFWSPREAWPRHSLVPTTVGTCCHSGPPARPPRPVLSTQPRADCVGPAPAHLGSALAWSPAQVQPALAPVTRAGGRLPSRALGDCCLDDDGNNRGRREKGTRREGSLDSLIQRWPPFHSRHARYISSNDMIMALAVFVSLSGHFGDVVIYLFQTQPSTPACCPTTLQSLLVTLNFKWLQFSS